MKRTIGIVLPFSLAATSLSGCIQSSAARVEPLDLTVRKQSSECYVDPPPRHRTFLGTVESVTRPGAINLDCFRLYKGATDTSPPLFTEILTLTESKPERAKMLRNALADALIQHADSICLAEESSMLVRQAQINGYSSIASTGLSTVSTIVTGNLAKSILSGGAAFVGASRDHINSNAYFNQLMPTIIRAIETERRKFLTNAIDKRREDSISGYSAYQMIRDANHYHQLCSFTVGIDAIVNSVEGKAESDDIRRVNGVRQSIAEIDAQLSSANIDQDDDLKQSLLATRKELVNQLVASHLVTEPGQSPDLETSGDDTDQSAAAKEKPKDDSASEEGSTDDTQQQDEGSGE
ncbi:hypothetical protein EV664_101240 [Stakelama pacifica]|uniref:Lipoprotein n=2 Tax=Stakelama pacifica TaxID=517720 RepID=A0A4R6FXF7_9SPHN|nr:hypothetical protein EV664_101240 [Stakelama pacifica]GGO90323.1 hypothetical protein GCM10011329_02360 [Stakelama pacifica]